MPKPLFKKIKLEVIKEQVEQATSFQSLLQQIGYIQTNDQRIINNLSLYLSENNIDYSHLKQKDENKTIICKYCKIEKPITEYYSSNGKTRHVCKDCVRAEQRNIYKDKQNQINNIKKNHKCAKCGDDRYYLIDFHHINPNEKDFSISEKPSLKLESLLKEIEKCIPLCSNCHREFHFLEREKSLSINEYLNGEVGELA